MVHIFLSFLFSLLLVAGSIGDDSLCSGFCDPSEKSHFRTGHTYKYVYTTDSWIYFNISNSQDDYKRTGFSFTAGVQLDIISACEMILRINDVVLRGREDPYRSYENFAADVSKHKLHVHTKDSKSVEICPSTDEQIWVLNIKRGILSALQFSVDGDKKTYNANETDIHGICKSQYTSYMVDGKKTIKRIRDLNDCMFRGGPYYRLEDDMDPSDDNFNSVDNFINTQECEYVFEETDLFKVDCREIYDYHPHQSDKVLGMAKIKQQLHAVSIDATSENVADFKGSRKETMYMDFELQGDIYKLENFEQVIDLFSSEKNYNRLMISLNNANFIALFKNFTSDELIAGYSRILNYKHHNRFERFYLYALLSAHTGGSIKAMADLEDVDVIEDFGYGTWFNGLPSIKNPTKELLVSLQPFLEFREKLEFAPYIGISGLIDTYCRSQENCVDNPEVRHYIDYWDSQIQNFDRDNDTEHEIIFHALIAIGNAGMTKSASSIKKIMTDRTLPSDMRLAAMQSFRKMPCSESITEIEGLFKDKADSKEMRIIAYMNAIRCQTEEFLEQVISTLQDEEYNEVTLFLWEHLQKGLNLPNSWKNTLSDVLAREYLVYKYQIQQQDYMVFYDHQQKFPILNSLMELQVTTSFKNKTPSFLLALFNMATVDQKSDQFSMWVNTRDIEKTVGRVIDENYVLLLPRSSDNDTDDLIKPEDLGFIYDEFAERYVAVKSNNSLNKGFMIQRNYNNDNIVGNMKTIIEQPLKMLLKLKGQYKFNNSLEIEQSSELYRFPTGVGFPLKTNIQYSLKIFFDTYHNIDTEAKHRKVSLDFDLKIKFDTVASAVSILDAHVAKRGLEANLNNSAIFNVKGECNIANGQWEKFEFDNLSPKENFLLSSQVNQILE